MDSLFLKFCVESLKAFVEDSHESIFEQSNKLKNRRQEKVIREYSKGILALLLVLVLLRFLLAGTTHQREETTGE